MELLQDHAVRMQSYGITVDEAQLTLVLLANIEHGKNENYGREFRPSLQNVRRTFPDNHVNSNSERTRHSRWRPRDA